MISTRSIRFLAFWGAGIGVAHVLAESSRGVQPATDAKSVAMHADPFAPTLRFENGPVIDVVPGRTAVVVFDPEWQFKLSAQPTVKLDDGRNIPASRRRIVVRPSYVIPAWISDPGDWTTVDVGAPFPADQTRTLTAEAMTLDLPFDAIGQGVWVDGQRLGLNWLITPQILSNLSDAEGLQWPPALNADQRQDSSLLAKLAPLSRSPMTRWRYRLLIDGLQPRNTPENAQFRYQDELLEALAQQQEMSWQHGLAKIKQAGPLSAEHDASHQVTRALTQIVRLDKEGTTVWLPSWIENPSALNQLLSDLVAPNLKPSDAANRALAFAELSPPLITWIVDDVAGLHPATRGAMPLAAILNLKERPAALSAQILDRSGRGHSPGSDLHVIAPESGLLVNDLAPPVGIDLTDSPALHVEGGSTKRRLTIQAGPLAVIPPGLTCAPFIADWRQSDLIRETPQSRIQPGLTAHLSYRAALRGDDSPDSPSGWVLLMERRSLPESHAEKDESIRVVWGPRQRETVLSVSRAESNSSLEFRQFIDPAGTWYVEIPLPASAIERDGLLQLGLIWNGGTGLRASWPRAMLPDDVSPGRALLNLNVW